MEAEHPLYGKHGDPPISPEQWWTELIRRCIKEAGATEAELKNCQAETSRALLQRFESEHGYVDFPETLKACTSIHRL
jgi:hypothetical protein